MSKLILSLDGGGIRGAATSQFLSRIEQQLNSQHGSSLRDHVDFYAGTSTGSFIALALATTQMTLDEINQLYTRKIAKVIFEENSGWFEIDGINAPKYEAKGKTRVLRQKFAQAKISDVVSDKHVLAVTYAIERRCPEVIKSTDARYSNLLVSEVADASSAAPTYFPTKALDIKGQQYWLVDGGVVANNPTMCAIAEARNAWQGVDLDDLRVLSIGTGSSTRKINGPASQKWGALCWFTQGHILDLLSDERVVEYQAKTITKPGNYIRVNSEMRRQTGLPNPPDDALDDISKENIKCLKAMGDFWYLHYGQAVIELLLNKYQGPSLGRICC